MFLKLKAWNYIMKDHTAHLRIPIHILVKITGVKQGRKTHDQLYKQQCHCQSQVSLILICCPLCLLSFSHTFPLGKKKKKKKTG